MHVHLPKPLHGWRAFAGEVGIIVIGVLIALGAEQAVEAMRWQERAESAEAAMKTELTDSLASAYEITTMQSCINNRLTLLSHALNSGDVKTARFIIDNDKSFPPRRLWPDDAWRAAISSGVTNHMPSDRLKAYSQVYDLVHLAGNAQNDSWHNVGELRAIDEAPLGRGYDASDPKARAIAAIREELASETQAAGYVTTIAKRRLGLALTSDQIARGNGHLRNIAACRAKIT